MQLTQELLKECLHYDPDTGLFYRKKKTSNNMKVGQVAGHNHIEGYLELSLFGKKYLCHRLAWLYMTGTIPDSDIDHINGVRNDNRFQNLRVANRSQNMMNTGLRANNTSGFKGVSLDKKTGKWEAYTKVNYKKISFGLFKTALDAHNERIKHIRNIQGEYYHA